MAIVREIEIDTLVNLYTSMYLSSEIDRLEQQYVQSGDAFFHVAGRGHEATAALGPHLIAADWLHCHYRSKALMLARGMRPVDFFNGFFGRHDSHSRGRQMSAHLSDRRLNILSIVGPVGNSALQAVGVAAQVRAQTQRPIAVCCLGEGMTQQGEVLEALQEAARQQLPVLFVIEDNGLAISTLTAGRTFYSLGGTLATRYCGIPIHYLDGADAAKCYVDFENIVRAMRTDRCPVIAVVETHRLSNHTNADDQRLYRPAEEIERESLEYCPVIRLEDYLTRHGQSAADLADLKARLRGQVERDAARALAARAPCATWAVARPLKPHLVAAAGEYTGEREGGRYTMLEALRGVLRSRLHADERVSLYGQDIEDPKGDVFGLTQGLSTRFPERVLNSPLSESTIVGTAIGRALAGGRPVALLQFADFLPLAFNQICSELSTLYWRTDGAWQCPVVIMAPCGGYRPGLGHFHAQTFDALSAQLPGIDVFVPSNAGEAAGLLNAAFESERPSIFFYPKALLNDRRLTTSTDVERQLVNIGRGRVLRVGRDLTVVAWGNTVERCLRAADLLAGNGRQLEVIDLRSISPWDKALVLKSVEKSRRLLVVHEDNLTCGMGAEIVASACETLGIAACARLAREDTHIPCHFANQLEVLPSVRTVTEAAAKLLGLSVTWAWPAAGIEGNTVLVRALGASPSDASVTVNAWHVRPGDRVQDGDLLVEYEADKAVTELLSPYSGEVKALLVAESDTIDVGEPLLELTIAGDTAVRQRPVMEEQLGTPVFTPLPAACPAPPVVASGPVRPGLDGIATRLGARSLSNEEIVASLPGKLAEDISKGTGIETRPRIGEGETVQALAIEACKTLLRQRDISVRDIDMLICATGTPEVITPSLACQVLAGLAPEAECQAHDINAACSGYLYALQTAWDYLQAAPEAKVLVVTAEVLSPVLDSRDFNTAILFGDAATATLLCGGAAAARCRYRLSRPLLSAQGDGGSALVVPHRSSGQHVTMDGAKVFSLGVRKMVESLKRMLALENLSLNDVQQIVPHQANQRILQAIEKKLGLEPGVIYSNIRRYGNTSSNTIPIALAELIESGELAETVALTAFGGGFTYGACLLRREDGTF